MKKWFGVSILGLGFFYGKTEYAMAATTEGYDLSKIKETSENVTFDSLGALAMEYSIPILVTVVIISGILALLGIAFKPLRAAAMGLLGTGVVFFIGVNYAPQITGIMIAIVDGIMSRVSGG